MAQELTTIKVELNCHGKPMASIQGTVSYYGITPYDKFYEKPEVDDLLAEKDAEIRRLQRALWLVRAERYKMREFIAREEANLRDLMAWSQFLRKRTYNQWVDQLLRIANLANKLYNKCRAKAEEYK